MIQKITVLLALLLISISPMYPQPAHYCYNSDSFTEYMPWSFDWESLEQRTRDEIKMQELEKIQGTAKSYIDKTSPGLGCGLSCFINWIHFIDLNSDTKADIIMETAADNKPTISICIKKDSYYTTLLHTPGFIKSIDRNKKIITIITYPTYDEKDPSSFNSYEIEYSLKGSTLSLLKACYLNPYTIFPLTYDASVKKFTVKKAGALLFDRPPFKKCLDAALMKGSFKYPEGATGTTLYTHQENGQTFHFVLMDNNMLPERLMDQFLGEVNPYLPSQYLTDPSKKIKVPFYGWVEGKTLIIK